MKKLLLFSICAILLMSCGGAGVDPSDNITFGQAFSKVSRSFSYWLWIVIACLPLVVYLGITLWGKVEEFKLPILFVLVAVLLIAIFMRPCEVAANTTVEQAARGVYIGY